MPLGPLPAADPNRPCLVLLHGAESPDREWRGGSPRECSALAEGLRAHGWAAALPGRGLAPAVTPSRIVHETHKALGWLMAQGPRHGIAGPLVVAGWGPARIWRHWRWTTRMSSPAWASAAPTSWMPMARMRPNWKSRCSRPAPAGGAEAIRPGA
ncbi:hypothetical protein ACFQU7_04510 [Pseudoroseomonas wenyumeiae]